MMHQMFDFIGIEQLPKSNKKKFKVILKNLNTNRTKTIQFGSNPYEHFTEGHLDKERQQNYIKRHKTREKWGIDGLTTSGFWSYHLLWEYPTYKKALKNILENFF
jgi:hypothetical protein